MFTKRKNFYPPIWIFAMLLLANILHAYNQNSLRHQDKKTQEELFEMRIAQGERLIPCGPLACVTAIIISYLGNCEEKGEYQERLNNLKNAQKKYYMTGFFGSIPKLTELSWEDINSYRSRVHNRKNFEKLIKKNKKIFEDFCKNLQIKPENIPANFKEIVSRLKTSIVVYEAKYQENRPVYVHVKTIPCEYPSTFSFTYPSPELTTESIRIVRDTYRDPQESRKKKIKNEIYHYRPLLSSLNLKKILNQSSVVSTSSNNRESVNQQGYQVSNNAIQNINPDINNTSYKPSINQIRLSPSQASVRFAAREITNRKEQQKLKFKKIQKNLKKMLQETEQLLIKSVEDTNIEDIQKYLSFYKKAEQSGLIKSLSFYSMVSLPSLEKLKKSIVDTIQVMKSEVKKVNFVSQSYLKKTAEEKRTYLRSINKKVKMLIFAKEKGYIKEVLPDIKNILVTPIEDCKNQAVQLLEIITFSLEDCEQINSFLQTFDFLDECLQLNILHETREEAKESKQLLMNELVKEVDAIKEKGTQKLDEYSVVGDNLIQLTRMQKFIDEIYVSGLGVNKAISFILAKYEDHHRKNSVIKLNKLASYLQTTPLGNQLVSENPAFRGITIMLRNTEFQSITFDYIMKNIREYRAKNNQQGIMKSLIENTYCQEISDAYNNFEETYWNLVECNLKFSNAPAIIASDIKKKFNFEDQMPGNIQWDSSRRQEIPEILAYIFAFWTLSNTDHYSKEEKANSNQINREYLLQPHAAQVVAVMRILGVDQGVLANHLVQVGTGEGKSLIAFATATTLALLGFDVQCVCYSGYISLRDQKNFRPLIEEIGVHNHITYTTFTSLSEATINQEGDVRTQVVDFINKNSKLNEDSDDEKKDNESDHSDSTFLESDNEFTPILIRRAQIIFIDEVDVFFDKSFYGEAYSPTALLQHPTITEIIEFVWENQKNITYQQVKKSNAYQKCTEVFSEWIPLIDQAIRNMVGDVQNFNFPESFIDNGQICYKDGDVTSTKINYKYKTTFACLDKKEKITQENLKDHLGIYLSFGVFSYAEIPHSFDCILGVTGTLDKLPTVALDIIEKGYNIKQHTYMPSLYGKSKRKFLKGSSAGLKIAQKQYYDSMLKKEIMTYLQGRLDNLPDKRAVIVFFETAKKLEHFHSSIMSSFKSDKINIMKSSLSYEEKNRATTKATRPGMITLAVREFGRGTDFINYDASVNQYGGVHVIITFFPESNSEEVQLIGRTARQGNNGSISMVLNQESLQSLMSAEEIDTIREKSNVFYSSLDEKRKEIFTRTYANSIKHVGKLKEKHKQTKEFFDLFRSGNIQKVTNYLLKHNIPPPSPSDVTRTIVLIDATGSMNETLITTKQQVITMFSRINEILKDKSGTFSMQFVAYRNYSSPVDMILEISPWANEPQQLIQFMGTIRACCGINNEAIELGLAHANREHSQKPIDQVILIGDMPPNTKQDIQEARSYYGKPEEPTYNSSPYLSDSSSDYHFGTIDWSEYPLYKEPTYYEDELKKLKDAGIPVHAFYIPDYSNNKNHGTKEAFTKIAHDSGGKCESLNIRSSEGAEQLTAIVSIAVLQKAAGIEAAEEYVRLYGGKSYL